MRRRRPKQLALQLHRRGGNRPGAGRKPNGPRAGVSHLRRPGFERALPVHVTLRIAKHVYNLRSRRAFSIIARAMSLAADRFGVRIVRFSVQGNHVHLVVEAADAASLSRAMQGFAVRIAKGLNAMMGRRGRVLADRYHARALRTPSEVRRVIAYVRDNHRKHMAQVGKPLARSFVDPFASEGATLSLAAPRTWLLRASIGPPSGFNSS